MKFKIYVEKRDLLEANWWEDDDVTLKQIREIISTIVMKSGKTTLEYEKEKESWYELLYSFYRSLKIIKEKESTDSKIPILKQLSGLVNLNEKNYINIKKAIQKKLDDNNDILSYIEGKIKKAVEIEIENEKKSNADMFSNGKNQSDNAFR